MSDLPDPSATPPPGGSPYPPPPPGPPGPPGYPGVAGYPGRAGHPGYAAYPYPVPPYGYAAPARTNTLAVVALVLSCLGFMTCFTGIAGIVTGYVARRQIRDSGEQGDGLALAAIIVGWVTLGIMLVVAVVYVAFFAFAITHFPGTPGHALPTYSPCNC